MPFPAAWKPLRNVGATGRNGSDADPRSDAEVRCSFRSRQSARRATGNPILSEIRCCHVLGLSEETHAPPAIEPASGPNSRQRSLSPCDDAATLPSGKASASVAFLSARIQPRTESRRAGMEAYETALYSQSVFSTTQRSGHRSNDTVGVVEESKPGAPTLMRHYLRRHV
jgi:hypothetical protein